MVRDRPQEDGRRACEAEQGSIMHFRSRFPQPVWAGARSPSRVLAVLALSTALTGCTIGLPYEPPSLSLSQRFSQPAPLPASRAAAAWWRAFGDSTLDHLMQRALQGSPRVAELRARLVESQAQARAAGNRFRGNGNATVEFNSNSPNQGELSLTALLDPAGANGQRARAASVRLDAARMGLEDARRTVLADLATAYVDLRYYQALEAQKRADLASRKRTLADIETQLSSGAATQLDVVRAKSLVAETEAELPGIEADMIRSRNRISTLVGVPAGNMGVNLGSSQQQPQPKGLTNFGVPADLLRTRPDVAQAERLYAAAISDIEGAEAARYPSLSLTGLLRAPLSGGSGTQGLEAGLVLPLFNQPALIAEVDAAHARADQAYAQWRLTVLTAVEEVESGLAGLDAAVRSARAADRALKLDLEALDLSRKLLENRGNITVLDLLDRERAVANSRSILAGNRREVALEFVQLQSALGGNSDGV
jgi:multidrug efflux system outer membrane protein